MKRNTATVATYTHDVAAGLPVIIDDGARRYVWGPGLAYAVTTTGGAIDMIHADGLGSVRALTDATGAVTQTYEYDAYGSPTSQTIIDGTGAASLIVRPPGYSQTGAQGSAAAASG